jgi:hypothetical protein
MRYLLVILVVVFVALAVKAFNPIVFSQKRAGAAGPPVGFTPPEMSADKIYAFSGSVTTNGLTADLVLNSSLTNGLIVVFAQEISANGVSACNFDTLGDNHEMTLLTIQRVSGTTSRYRYWILPVANEVAATYRVNIPVSSAGGEMSMIVCAVNHVDQTNPFTRNLEYTVMSGLVQTKGHVYGRTDSDHLFLAYMSNLSDNTTITVNEGTSHFEKEGVAGEHAHAVAYDYDASFVKVDCSISSGIISGAGVILNPVGFTESSMIGIDFTQDQRTETAFKMYFNNGTEPDYSLNAWGAHNNPITSTNLIAVTNVPPGFAGRSRLNPVHNSAVDLRNRRLDFRGMHFCTIAGWMNLMETTSGRDHYIVNQYGGATASRVLRFGFDGQGTTQWHWHYDVFEMGSGVLTVADNQFFSLNTWYHFAWVYSNGTVFTYVDADNVKTNNTSVEGPMQYGQTDNSVLFFSYTTTAMDGYLDEVVVIGAALSQAEIAALRTNGMDLAKGAKDVTVAIPLTLFTEGFEGNEVDPHFGYEYQWQEVGSTQLAVLQPDSTERVHTNAMHIDSRQAFHMRGLSNAAEPNVHAYFDVGSGAIPSDRPIYTRVYLNFNSATANDEFFHLAATDSTSFLTTQAWHLEFGENGSGQSETRAIMFGGPTRSAFVASNEWVRIETKYDRSAGTLDWRINGADQTQSAGTTNRVWRYVQIGTTESGDGWLDNWMVSTNDWIGQ